MSSFTDVLEAELLDHLFGIGAYSAPALHVGLYTVAPTDSTTGTEVTDANGYARTSDLTGASNWTLATSTITNDNNIDIGPNTSSDWGTVLAMAISDSGTHDGGNQLMWDAFSGVAFVVDDTARFAASTGITVTLD